MNAITWLIIGGLVGGLVNLATRIDAQEKIYLNVAVGIVGAVCSGWFLSPYLGISAINHGSLSLGGVFASFLGAVVLLAIVNLVWRGAVSIKW